MEDATISSGNDAVGDNPPIVIEVVDEMIERGEPLDQPALDSRPFEASIVRGMTSNGHARSIFCPSV